MSMRKIKQYNVLTKIRPALRKIYRYSPMRKEALAKAVLSNGYFKCPTCAKSWPLQMADVDHQPPLGSFINLTQMADWAYRLFYGPVQVLCKICHAKKTKEQRRSD